MRRLFGADELAPGVAVARDHLVGGGGAGGAGLVDVNARGGFPDLEDGLDELPGAIDGVASVEQGRVAAHAVEQEALVGLGDRALEGVGVGHGHEDVADVDGFARDLGDEAERDALVGLDAQGEDGGLEDAAGGFFLEEHEGDGAEVDVDLGQALGELLARAQVERHALPAPAVDHEAHGGEGRGLRVGGDAVLLAVAAVLAADAVVGDVVEVEVADRAQDLGLLVADVVGGERGRYLHGDEGHDLEQVVLDDVADHARGLVERAAALDADRLGGGDLDVVDVVAIPDRLEDRVAEPQDQDVLDRLFAEVVIDPVDLGLVEVGADHLVEPARGQEVAAERLLDDDAAGRLAEGLDGALDQRVLLELLEDHG